MASSSRCSPEAELEEELSRYLEFYGEVEQSDEEAGEQLMNPLHWWKVSFIAG